MKRYGNNSATKTQFSVNESVIGERIEERVARMLYSGEAIGDGAPLIYTDRREGVKPEYDIRTDRFEMALDAMNGITEKGLNTRYELYKRVEEDTSKEGGGIVATNTEV
jgi:hypothetical protein